MAFASLVVYRSTILLPLVSVAMFLVSCKTTDGSGKLPNAEDGFSHRLKQFISTPLGIGSSDRVALVGRLKGGGSPNFESFTLGYAVENISQDSEVADLVFSVQCCSRVSTGPGINQNAFAPAYNSKFLFSMDKKEACMILNSHFQCDEKYELGVYSVEIVEERRKKALESVALKYLLILKPTSPTECGLQRAIVMRDVNSLNIDRTNYKKDKAGGSLLAMTHSTYNEYCNSREKTCRSGISSLEWVPVDEIYLYLSSFEANCKEYLSGFADDREYVSQFIANFPALKKEISGIKLNMLRAWLAPMA